MNFHLKDLWDSLNRENMRMLLAIGCGKVRDWWKKEIWP